MRVIPWLLAAVLSFPLPTCAQGVAIEGVDPGQVQEIPNPDIPRYFVVAAFFETAEEKLQPTGRLSERLLGRLEMKEDGPEARALVDAVREASAVLSQRHVDPTLEGQAFVDHQIDMVRQKAERLGFVYLDLLDQLEGLDYPRSTLEAYLQREIRPTLALFSSGDPEDDLILGSVRAFDAVVPADR